MGLALANGQVLEDDDLKLINDIIYSTTTDQEAWARKELFKKLLGKDLGDSCDGGCGCEDKFKPRIPTEKPDGVESMVRGAVQGSEIGQGKISIILR